MIGRNKYMQLKSLLPDLLTSKDLDLIAEYEGMQPKPDPEYMKSYIQKLDAIPSEKEFQFESWQCYDLFQQAWGFVHNKPFQLNDDMFVNLRFLNRYFAMYDISEFVEPQSKYDIGKGLLIVGGYGNGKTSVMMAYRKAFETFKGYSFKQYSANEVVEKYELSIEGYQKRSFWKEMVSGVIHFDDVLTEPVSSNFGKKEIFKDIIEKRYDAGLKTHMTINTRVPGDLQDAIEQIAERYGERVYDRIFEMFNIYHWKGKSYRK